MENNLKNRESILVAGNGRILYSISACLLRAGHLVVLFTEDTDGAIKRIQMHYKDLSGLAHKSINPHSLEVTNRLNNNIPYQLVIAVTGENIEEKRNLIHLIEKKAPNDAIIAINTESIPLSALQEGCNYPGRIIGANWAEPAHTTFFLELIINKIADRKYADRLFYLAKNYWNKDPYLVLNDTGIRARMFAAMMREALYLVKNEYASVEDIDRACRNDAGYYLPFAGNCRYMDLMGTYAYGMVMQELNPDLSKDGEVAPFFKRIVEQGGMGMQNGNGFYQYDANEAKKWDQKFRRFSYQIEKIISKYPFNYKKEICSTDQTINSNGQ